MRSVWWSIGFCLLGSGLLLAACQTQPEPSEAESDQQENGGTAALQDTFVPKKGVFKPGTVQVLFNGKDLSGWRVLDEFFFEDHGPVQVTEGSLHLESGQPMTGIVWDGAFPTNNYEVQLEAMRVDGSDFFCGMTFPVADAFCTLIVGGWGGMVFGLSNIDGMSAAENQTTYGIHFDDKRWYVIRLRVTAEAIEVWLDGEQKVHLTRAGHKFDIWWQQEPARPFGFNTYYTHGALRNITLNILP